MFRLHSIVAPVAAVVLSAAAGTAVASTLLFDDFESYGSASLTNFTGFHNLVVTNGTVDYVHEPDFGLMTPYGQGMVDLDGSTMDAGTLSTVQLSAHAGDQVIFEFDLSGNQRGDNADIVQFGFAAPSNFFFSNAGYGCGNIRRPIPSFTGVGYGTSCNVNEPWQHYFFTFKAPSEIKFLFRVAVAGDGGDNVGPLIDNVRVSTYVPEPEVWITMILGFGMSGAMLRKTRSSFQPPTRACGRVV